MGTNSLTITNRLKSKRCDCHSCSSADQQDDFTDLYLALGSIAAFGGGITFAGIIANIDEGHGHHRRLSGFSQHHARGFLAISWLLFTLDLCLSSMMYAASRLSQSLLSNESWAISLMRWANLLSALILPCLLVAALLMASLAVCAYCRETGWIAVGFCTFFGLMILCWWLLYLR